MGWYFRVISYFPGDLTLTRETAHFVRRLVAVEPQPEHADPFRLPSCSKVLLSKASDGPPTARNGRCRLSHDPKFCVGGAAMLWVRLLLFIFWKIGMT